MTHNVLFLCTGNSARSVLAEATLRAWAGNRFKVFSAGSQPTGTVNPFALAQLQAEGISTAGLRSKSWDEFTTPGAPRMDLVVVPSLWTEMVQDLVDRYYFKVTRYSTSGFLRAKLGPALAARGVAAHIYETAEQAQAGVRR